MTEAELIDVLAGTLETLAGKFRARLDSPSGFDPPSLRGTLKHAEAVCVEAVGLADDPRENPAEEDALALEAVALDHLTSLGTGLPTCLRDTTWERVRLALARHGRPVEEV